MNKRRLDEVSLRQDSHSSIASTGPYGSSAPHSAQGGYVRVPPSNMNIPTQGPRVTPTVVTVPGPVSGPTMVSHEQSHPAYQQGFPPREILASSHAPMFTTGPPLTSPVVARPNAGVSAVSNNAASTGGSPQGPGYQKLKVEDALSYLDRVKAKFGNQPQVYNDFLDIMKEFKSQSIDTPGVIARVSQLFKGFPELTYGFNTFLPPGYKIEILLENLQVSSNGPNHTTVVHTPQGIQHHLNMGMNSIVQPTVTKESVGPASTQRGPMQSQISSMGFSTMSIPTTQNSSVPMGLKPNLSLSGQTAVPMVVTTTAQSQPAPILSLASSVPTSASVVGSQQANPHQAVANSTIHCQQNAVPQPVEFNHAINYVNKIKNRFQEKPDIYKQFLEILHTYQKEQKVVKEGGSVPSRVLLTEGEVYEKVAKLFVDQEDLLQEFGQFLPDATNTNASTAVSSFMDQCHTTSNIKAPSMDGPPKKCQGKGLNCTGQPVPLISPPSVLSPTNVGSLFPNSAKRTMGSPSPLTQMKRPRLSFLKDMSAAEAGKFAALSDYGYFDKVRKVLRTEDSYRNFLRCIQVFNDGVLSPVELLMLVQPFLCQYPDLIKELKTLLYPYGEDSSRERVSSPTMKQDRISGDLALEVDFSSCKRLGASYCHVPPSNTVPTCSGRTAICNEVLNDEWVSFPTWSEDSTFVTSKKTQFEEYIYRCEDERFELDIVLEVNLSTIAVLNAAQRKMERMTPEELSRHQLDDSLGGTAPTVYKRAIFRLYGEKANDIIDGLKKNPSVAVPLVLRRLRAKQEEWREAQKGFNKLWKEQNERYYLKSLDHQGMNFKQNDIKALRSKTLVSEIETLYDERHEQAEDGGDVVVGPHLVFSYKDKSVMDDAANMIIHHVRRQQAIGKDDKAKIKALMRNFLPDLLFHPRMDQSDDEKDDDDDNEDDESDCSQGRRKDSQTDTCTNGSSVTSTVVTGSSKRKTRGLKSQESPKDSPVPSPKPASPVVNGDNPEVKQEVMSPPVSPGERTSGQHAPTVSGEEYRIFMCNTNWYILLRLHHILCERLSLMLEHTSRLIIEEAKEKKNRKTSAALALQLRPKYVAADKIYQTLLDSVKSLLDGNIEATTYEDSLREMFGTHAYHAFTLDKVVTNAVRQLQHIVTDDLPSQCSAAFLCEARRGGAGGPCVSSYRRQHLEIMYQKRIEKLHSEDNCFKIRMFKKENQMTIEMLDTEGDESEENASGSPLANNDLPVGISPHPPMGTPVIAEAERWSQYVDRYISTSSSSEEVSGAMRARLALKPVFLLRNLRSWKKFTTNKESQNEPYQDQDLDVRENSECKFNPTTYKMVFVVNSDSFMYKKRALEKARTSHKTVTQRMKSGMQKWVKTWCDKHIPAADHHRVTEWFEGRGEDLAPNTTKLETKDSPSTTPYYAYTKYRCKVNSPSS